MLGLVWLSWEWAAKFGFGEYHAWLQYAIDDIFIVIFIIVEFDWNN